MKNQTKHSGNILKLHSKKHFIKNLTKSFFIGIGLITISLLIGGFGYHYFGNLDWLSAYLNASMILTGMGPVDPMIEPSGKLFAIFYSLFSGVTFLIIAGIIFAPIYQRFLHKFHLDIYTSDKENVEDNE
jgi:TM2 domain-containing membrane protein YozV